MAKPTKLKARLPRGLADRGPAEIAATRHMVEAIRVVFERYGFEPVETPAIEYTDALGKFLPDQDRPNEGVFSFQDDDEQWLSLRYDLTAPLARYVAENFQNLALPYRSLPLRLGVPQREAGPGTLSPVHAVRCRHRRRAVDGRRCRDVHARGRHDGSARHSARQLCGEGEQPQGSGRRDGCAPNSMRRKRLTTMRAIDKLDRLGIDGVRMLLGKGRKDESGDFTKGAELADSQIAGIVAAISSATKVNVDE